MSKTSKGFTLIELLIVIAIIAILAVVVFVALDPLTRFRSARDAQRWTDIDAMVEAILLDQVDNGGEYISAVDNLTASLAYTIGECNTGGDSGCTSETTQTSCVDLSGLVSEGYLAKVPQDPNSGTDNKTDYYLIKANNGTITIGACDPELATNMEISR